MLLGCGRIGLGNRQGNVIDLGSRKLKECYWEVLRRSD